MKSLVANFACFNLEVKLSAPNSLNSRIVIYIYNDLVFSFHFCQFMCYSQLFQLNH